VKIRPVDFEPTPDVFAAVMATGILSIAVRNHYYSKLSDVLGVVASDGLVCSLPRWLSPRSPHTGGCFGT
jgi:hypothetical protein